VRIFQGMFAAVLKDRFRLSASALGTNPFFGFLCICHNQAFELMFAVRAFDDIDRHQLTSFLAEIVVCDCWFYILTICCAETVFQLMRDHQRDTLDFIEKLSNYRLTLFFTVCLPMTFKELIFIEHSGFNRSGNPSKINHVPGIDIFCGYIFSPGSATQA
jgi:hypothetical protein